MTTENETLSIFSIGKMASELRWTVARTRGSLDALGHRPHMSINEVPHYDVAAFVAVLKLAHAEDRAEGITYAPEGNNV